MKGLLSLWVPPIVWMGFIFFMSTSGFSAEVTRGILLPMFKFFFYYMPEGFLVFAHSIIRKAAHFNEYAVLSFLVFRALEGRSAGVRTLGAALICALYAGSDEYHQSFVSVRTASMKDVGIDTAGAVFMQLAIWFHGGLGNVPRKNRANPERGQKA